MALTRFQDRDGVDGPVSGAIQIIPVLFDSIATNTTVDWEWTLPAGAEFEIIAVESNAGAVTNDPSLSVSATVATTSTQTAGGVVAAVNIITTSTQQTIVDGSVQVPKGGTAASVKVAIVADADDTATNATVNLVGYLSRPPISVLSRGQKNKEGYAGTSTTRTVPIHF